MQALGSEYLRSCFSIFFSIYVHIKISIFFKFHCKNSGVKCIVEICLEKQNFIKTRELFLPKNSQNISMSVSCCCKGFYYLEGQGGQAGPLCVEISFTQTFLWKQNTTTNVNFEVTVIRYQQFQLTDHNSNGCLELHSLS